MTLRTLSLKNPLRHTLAALGICAISASAFAHDIYVWPSYFSLSAEKTAYVPVDVTASHTTFRPDYAMPSNGLKVFGVDGKEVDRKGAYFEGARRASFDLAVEAEGTYLVYYSPEPSYFTSYLIGRSDERKWLPGNKSAVKDKVPSKAEDVKTARYESIAQSYVTNNAPTPAVLEAKKTGFEVVPVTHPADYVTGEEIVISLLFNGEPVVDQDVVVELEGPQYKAEPVVLELKSNEKGEIAFTLTEGGRYMFKTNYERASEDPEADVIITRAYYAFEAIYE